MIVSKEQYRAAASAESRRIRRFKARSQLFSKVFPVLLGLFALCMILFIVLRILGKNSAGNVFGVISCLLALGTAAAAAMQTVYADRIIMDSAHVKPDKYLIKAEKIIYQSPYTKEAEKALNDALAAETDSRRCAYLRALLFDHNCITGDLDSAFRSLYNDKDLFSRDRFAEMRYYANLVCYYVSVPSTTGGSEYAEDAYRTFEKLYKEYAPAKEDFSAVNHAMDAQIMIMYSRGEWQSCHDMSRLRTDLYLRREKDAAVTRSAVAVDRILQAECMYHLGDYNGALALCTEVIPELSHIKYQAERADKLAANIRAAISALGE